MISVWAAFLILYVIAEKVVTTDYYSVHIALDDLIPFCEWFVIPYCLWMALLACTGLLVGNFNRRGQGKIISCSIAAMVLIEAGDLAFGNLCGKSLYFLTLLYANLIVPFIVCLYLLFFYNPAWFTRRNSNRSAR